METFGGLLALAAILLFIICLIGLIFPRLLKHPKTGTVPQRKHLAIFGLVVPLVMFAIGGSMLPKPQNDTDAQPQALADAAAPATTPATAHSIEPTPTIPTIKTLGMTAQEFQKRFNATASNAGADIKIKRLNVQSKPDGVNDTFMHTAGNGYLVGVIDRQSKQLTAINMGLAGGDDPADGLILIGTALHASTDDVEAGAIGKALSSLMSKAMADIEKPNAKLHEMRVGNRMYAASANKATGLMLFVTPAQ
jgi:hypothetical protein